MSVQVDQGARDDRLAPPSGSQDGAIYAAALVLIVLVGIAARVPLLSRPMAYDESFTFLRFASKSLDVVLSDYSYPNNHVFHTLLVHAAYRLLGNEPWVLRLPAFIAGVLLVPATHWAAGALFDRRAAILASALVASSSALIDFSTNARGYTIVCLVFVSSLGLAARLHETCRLAPWLLLALLSAIGFFTVPVMLYPFGIVAIWLLLTLLSQATSVPRALLLQRFCLFIVGTLLLTAVFYTPVLLESGPRSMVGNRFVAPLSWSRFVEGAPALVVEVWSFLNRDVPAVIVACLAGGVVASLLLHRSIAGHRIPLGLVAPLWLVPVLLVQRVLPVERIWLFLAPLYLILASAGLSGGLGLALSRLGRHQGAVVACGSAVLALGLSWQAVRAQLDRYAQGGRSCVGVEELSQYLKSNLRDGDKVMAIFPIDYPVRYYFDKLDIPASHFARDVRAGERTFVIIETEGRRGGEPFDVRDLIREGYTSPRLLRTCRLARLYQIEPRT